MKKKTVNSKRSLAMKESWARRRNSPGRKLARERQAAKVTQRVTSKIDGRQDRVEAIEVAVIDIRDAIGEMREAMQALKGLIDMHVGAYEKRLKAIEERFEIPPKIGDGNAQGVWMDRAYVLSLEQQLARAEAKLKGRK